MNAIPSTPAARAGRPLRAGAERPLYVAGALVVAVIVFAGFARTFYLRGWFDARPLSLLLLVHGVVMTAWVAVFVAQVTLVARRRTDLHRRLGVAGAVAAALVVVVGIAAGLDAGRRGFTPTPEVTPLMFLAVPLVDIALFGSFVAVAVWRRRRPDLHKRLMLLATLVLLTPAIARLPIDALSASGLPGFFGVTIVGVVAVIAFDTWRNRRLHPAFAWGGALFISSVPLRIALAQTEAWGRFAAWLVG